MAVLESKDIAHPAIEALFTIDEETEWRSFKP
jgi:dipeptidase D